MPHIRIQHFSPPLPDDILERLSTAITASVRDAIGCVDEAISIAIEPVSPPNWTHQVYEPVIAAEAHWLVKPPGYGRLAEAAT